MLKAEGIKPQPLTPACRMCDRRGCAGLAAEIGGRTNKIIGAGGSDLAGQFVPEVPRGSPQMKTFNDANPANGLLLQKLGLIGLFSQNDESYWVFAPDDAPGYELPSETLYPGDSLADETAA